MLQRASRRRAARAVRRLRGYHGVGAPHAPSGPASRAPGSRCAPAAIAAHDPRATIDAAPGTRRGRMPEGGGPLVRIHRGFLGWGVFFIVLGLVPLSVRLGWVSGANLASAWQLWPLFLVGAGVGLILRRTPFEPVGGLIVAATGGLMLGSFLAIGPSIGVACAPAASKATVASESGTLGPGATVSLQAACARATASAGPGDAWTVAWGPGVEGPARDRRGHVEALRERALRDRERRLRGQRERVGRDGPGRRDATPDGRGRRRDRGPAVRRAGARRRDRPGERGRDARGLRRLDRHAARRRGEPRDPARRPPGGRRDRGQAVGEPRGDGHLRTAGAAPADPDDGRARVVRPARA